MRSFILMKQLLGQCQMHKKIRLKLRCDGQGIAYIYLQTQWGLCVLFLKPCRICTNVRLQSSLLQYCRLYCRLQSAPIAQCKIQCGCSSSSKYNFEPSVTRGIMARGIVTRGIVALDIVTLCIVTLCIVALGFVTRGIVTHGIVTLGILSRQSPDAPNTFQPQSCCLLHSSRLWSMSVLPGMPVPGGDRLSSLENVVFEEKPVVRYIFTQAKKGNLLPPLLRNSVVAVRRKIIVLNFTKLFFLFFNRLVPELSSNMDGNPIFCVPVSKNLTSVVHDVGNSYFYIQTFPHFYI